MTQHSLDTLLTPRSVAIVGAHLDDDAGDSSGSAYLFDVDPSSPTFGDELSKLTASDAALDDWFGFNAVYEATAR